jgi:hypothetical protein
MIYTSCAATCAGRGESEKNSETSSDEETAAEGIAAMDYMAAGERFRDFA